jgi:hypothetical protein
MGIMTTLKKPTLESPQEGMGHPAMVHKAQDGTAERKERIQIRQFGPHHQRDGRRRPVALLQARLGEQRSGKAMGQIIGHHSLSILPTPRSHQTGESRLRLHSGASTPRAWQRSLSGH